LAEQNVQASALGNDAVRQFPVLLFQNFAPAVTIALFNFKLRNKVLPFFPLNPRGFSRFPLRACCYNTIGFPLGQYGCGFPLGKARRNFFNLR
jgi:hypothetical protein